MSEDLGHLHTALYFGLESVRQANGQALIDAMRAGMTSGFRFSDWSRIVDFRYSLEPLSVAGSIKTEGGRFNIGNRLSPGAFSPFPALYVAEDYATAYRERFGQLPDERTEGLTGAELALRGPASFTHVRVHGQVDLVLDVGDAMALKSFIDVIRGFRLPAGVSGWVRRLGLQNPPSMVRSVGGLQRQLLQRAWRMLPMQYDLPANSQVFGRIAVAAGAHGILYPSVRAQGRKCLALFPQNWIKSGSFVEVSDAVPAGARLVRIDSDTPSI